MQVISPQHLTLASRQADFLLVFSSLAFEALFAAREQFPSYIPHKHVGAPHPPHFAILKVSLSAKAAIEDFTISLARDHHKVLSSGAS